MDVRGYDIGTVTFDDPTVYNDGTLGGITVSGNFVGNYPPLLNSVQCRWVQIITTNSPLNTNAAANTPYFDPGELDPTGDKDPFYWNTTLKGNDGNNYPQFYYVNIAMFGVAAVAALLAYEHSLVRHDDLSKLNAAFFTMNGVISVVFFVFVAGDLLIRR